MNAAQAASADRGAKSKSSRARDEPGAASEDVDEEGTVANLDSDPLRGSASTAATPAAWAPFAEALTNFYRDVQDAWRREDVGQRAEEAFGQVLEALRGAPDAADLHNRAVTAQRNLAEKLRDASSAADAPQRMAQAYADYLAELADSDGSAELAQRVEKAYDDYLHVLADASSMRDVETRAAAAYDAYVKALREAWTAADPDALDVSTLAVIAQSIMAAALAHASTLTGIGQAAVVGSLATGAATQ
jgi:hypothetical protein